MARFKAVDMSPRMLPVVLEEQLIAGNNEEFVEKNIGSAKNEDLKHEIPQVLMRSIDKIYRSRFQEEIEAPSKATETVP